MWAIEWAYMYMAVCSECAFKCTCTAGESQTTCRMCVAADAEYMHTSVSEGCNSYVYSTVTVYSLF